MAVSLPWLDFICFRKAFLHSDWFFVIQISRLMDPYVTLLLKGYFPAKKFNFNRKYLLQYGLSIKLACQFFPEPLSAIFSFVAIFERYS